MLAIAAVATGTALQASVGFGLALIAAPLLLLLDRHFVPGPLTTAALLLTITMAMRERHAIDTSGMKVAILGRVLGTLPGAAAVGLLAASSFDLLFAALVLAAVVISLVHRDIQPTPRVVFAASVASGFMGTISSIGGPPLALVYQHASGARLRATLAGLFVIGCIITLVALALVGQMGRRELLLALVLLPGIAIGLVASRPLVPLLDRGATRPLVLALSTASALVVLARALLQGGCGV